MATPAHFWRPSAPTDWSGSAGDTNWTVRTDRARKKGAPYGPVLESSTVFRAPRGEAFTARTRHGEIAVDTAELGKVDGALHGRVQVETLAPSAPVAAGPLSEDYPSCTKAADGVVVGRNVERVCTQHLVNVILDVLGELRVDLRKHILTVEK